MYLLHTSKEIAHLIDAEGKTYHIPPNEAWEVPEIRGTDIPGPAGAAPYKTFVTPSHKVGEMLMKQGVYYGLVEVHQVRQGNSIIFDVEGAMKASGVARKQAEDAMLQTYVKAAKEDELGKHPIRPPSAPIQKILNERGLDLKRDFGVQPVGWTLSEGAKARDAEMAALKSELAELKAMLEMAIEDKKPKGKRESVNA